MSTTCQLKFFLIKIIIYKAAPFLALSSALRIAPFSALIWIAPFYSQPRRNSPICSSVVISAHLLSGRIEFDFRCYCLFFRVSPNLQSRYDKFSKVCITLAYYTVKIRLFLCKKDSLLIIIHYDLILDK